MQLLVYWVSQPDVQKWALPDEKFAAEHFSTDFINQATISIYQQILAK